jgi:ferredoxin
MKYLGREAKFRGVAFSLILGSISAGPIYAAFPLCRMLHKKGASVRNLVVILSALAVIKVPMLLNEMKFLGVRFMLVRWGLTVLAIVVFSLIADRLVKDADLPTEGGETGPSVDASACVGCALCARSCPEAFEMRGKKAALREGAWEANRARILLAAKACPVGAIAPGEEGEGD